MAWPSSLPVALKEWATVCRALESGRQIVLLRKGGVSDTGGKFELKHPEFLLFPTYLHQNLNFLKPEVHAGFEPWAQEPTEVKITAVGVATDIIQLKSREQMQKLDAAHIWTPAMIDFRFNYKPENPLYLVLIRMHRLHEPLVIQNIPAYAGCKSWVPLEQPVSTGGSLPVLDDVKYDFLRKDILSKLQIPNDPSRGEK